MTSMTKVVRFDQTGGPEVLKLEDIPLAEPGPGEVRVRVEAIGLNRSDSIFREGHYLQKPTFLSRLGADAAGIVEAVGSALPEIPDVSHQPAFARDIGPNRTPVKVGDRVVSIAGFNLSKHGVFGETTILPASFVTPYPQTLAPTEAASLLVPYLTPWGALVDYGQMHEGDYVLLTAASSSVGLAALQVVRAAGAIAIATTRSAKKKQALLDAGAEHVIVTSEEDLVKRVQEITVSIGVRLIFDSIAGSSLEQLAEVAAVGANIFLYGALSTEPTPLPLWTVMAKELNVRGYSLYEVFGSPARFSRAMRYLEEGVRAGNIKPVIDRTFTFDRIVEAHHYLESNQQLGRIVVTV